MPQDVPSPFRIVVIGAGFGGLGMGVRLKALGFDDFVILEKSPRLGGVWHDNTYPGAACDIPSHLYSFSFAPKHDWSRTYPNQAEILDYLEHCAGQYGLREHLRFNTEVARAEFDETQGLWRINLKTGETLTANALISACGQLNRPAYPRIKGIETFTGEAFHSARWNHRYDFGGKTVGVIGTGASAIQFVPRVAAAAKQVVVYQRSAPYILPKPDRPYTGLEKRAFALAPGWRKLVRAMIYLTYEARALGFTRFHAILDIAKRQCVRHLKKKIRDPKLREVLTPDYPIGCKRVLLADDYYPALAQPHVEVVTQPIQEIGADYIRTADGAAKKVDAIIFGTGFQATDFLAPMAIRGLRGRDLNDAWREGAEAYLGITVSGFPNFFMLYGPNTNLGHNSIIYMLESQINYIGQGLAHLRRAGVAYIDVQPAVQQRFNGRVQKRMQRTVWQRGCTSWYKNAAGKNTNNWPGFTFEYRRLTRRFAPHDYSAYAAPRRSAQDRSMAAI